jgi:hypothetical protein
MEDARQGNWDRALKHSDAISLSGLLGRSPIKNGILTILSLSDFGPVRALLQPVALKAGGS